MDDAYDAWNTIDVKAVLKTGVPELSGSLKNLLPVNADDGLARPKPVLD